MCTVIFMTMNVIIQECIIKKFFIEHMVKINYPLSLSLYMQMVASCINLQLPIVILKKSRISDMHHHITYMYNNFQQICACKSVKTVHTNIFENNCKQHKFATINSHFEKIDYFSYV